MPELTSTASTSARPASRRAVQVVSGRPGRQHELEPAAATELAVKLDPPAERKRQLASDGKTEPGALPVVRPEWAEDALLFLGAYPRPRVLDGDVDQPVLRAQPHTDLTSVRRPAEGVCEQVRDDL